MLTFAIHYESFRNVCRYAIPFEGNYGDGKGAGYETPQGDYDPDVNLIVYATYDASASAAEHPAGDYAQPAERYRVGADYEHGSALHSLHSNA